MEPPCAAVCTPLPPPARVWLCGKDLFGIICSFPPINTPPPAAAESSANAIPSLCESAGWGAPIVLAQAGGGAGTHPLAGAWESGPGGLAPSALPFRLDVEAARLFPPTVCGGTLFSVCNPPQLEACGWRRWWLVRIFGGRGFPPTPNCHSFLPTALPTPNPTSSAASDNRG